ncbi:hypothetical protein TNCV_3729171 [Trichonephila clavipes]|nr:hypothetical protein TNCV_3729171 [Trichonephila clavipes]
MPTAYYYPSDCEGDIRSPFRKCTSPLPVYEESEEELLVPESPKVSKPKKRLSRIRNKRGATFSIFVRGDKTARASPTLLHYSEDYTATKNNKPH